MTRHELPRVTTPRPAEPLISLVCPVFREEATIGEFYRRATDARGAIDPPVRHELVFVNDGSDDASGDILREMCAKDPRVKLVELSRNFGHQLAITSGVDHAAGDAIVLIDTDLQDPPAIIGVMVERWREGWDVVYGRRTAREGEPRLKLLAVRVFYRLMSRPSETELPEDVGDFRLMDRHVCDELRGMREDNRYLRGLVAWLGFQQTAVSFARDGRFAGDSNYRLARRLRLAFDGLTSFSERPLRFASGLGLVTTLVALVLATYVAVTKIVDPSRSTEGYASLMIVVLLLGGIQLLGIGLIGEYLGRTYRESKRRPLYIVRDRVNFEDREEGR
jgi:polyisoprenyl-phosphate glycosyltransferase